FSPLAMLRNIVCNKQFAGIGLVMNIEDGKTIVKTVQEGDPADIAGLKAGDIITQIDHQSLQGMAADKVLEMLHGSVDTEVKLTVLRKGQDKPMELSATRKMIHLQSGQGQEKK